MGTHACGAPGPPPSPHGHEQLATWPRSRAPVQASDMPSDSCSAVPTVFRALFTNARLSPRSELRLGSAICACERQSVPAFSVTTVDTCCWPLPSPVGAGRPCEAGGVPAPSRSGEQGLLSTGVPLHAERVPEASAAQGEPGGAPVSPVTCPSPAPGDSRNVRPKPVILHSPLREASPQVGGESPCQRGGVYTGRSWDPQPTGSEQAVTSGHLGTHDPHPCQHQLRDSSISQRRICQLELSTV